MPGEKVRSLPVYELAARYVSSRGAFSPTDEAVELEMAGVFDLCVTDVMARGRRLRQDIADRNFGLVFQPIVRLTDGRVAHHEVLVRFDDGRSPAPLVLLAEALGFCAELDLAVLDRTLGVINARAHDRLEPLALAVNLSARSLADPGFVACLMRRLKTSGVSPHLLMFEITESSRDETLDSIACGIASLRGGGFAVALDDFGAGASSLHRLSGIEVDLVKIDGSLVRGLGQNPRNEAVVRGICNICLHLGVGVIGECVETDTEARTLRLLGAQAAQGWHYGKPHPALPSSSP